MKIIRFEANGKKQYGILEEDQAILCTGDPFSGLKRTREALPLDSIRLLAPVEPPNVICLGLNYKRHAEDCKYPFPTHPLLFFKTTTAVCGPYDDIIIPVHHSDKIDYEVELAIVIGKTARFVPLESASEYIFGFTVANDVSNRGVQFQDTQWARGKSYDTFCPLGPAIATDLDGDQLDLSCRIDDQVMQSSNTSDLIFKTGYLVSFISECMTLLPGTVILTGTPEGVGFTRKPPFFLKAGQTVECEIEGIGILRNRVVNL
jgi:2-keto-4-pentenoate hydratase/2-oxohepta-3-ene-1,7-dioic acid hydratase in catechol pathway